MNADYAPAVSSPLSAVRFPSSPTHSSFASSSFAASSLTTVTPNNFRAAKSSLLASTAPSGIAAAAPLSGLDRRGSDTPAIWTSSLEEVAQRRLVVPEAMMADQASGASRSVIMISGGTGGNCFALPSRDCMHVLPISDDGGSSSEILRCLGGPSVGDIRSRLIRLIPLDEFDSSIVSSVSPIAIRAIHGLLAHRFPTDCSEKDARTMWADVVEGRSKLWRDIPIDRKECLRSVLVHFHTLVLKRTHKRFSYRNFSVGNGFLAGARDMLGGLPSAIFMFQALTNSQHVAPVIPVILTNQALTIAAELVDGSKIIGQSEISHPAPAIQQQAESSRRRTPVRRRRDSGAFDTAESVVSSSDDEATTSRSPITISRRSSTTSSISDGGFYGNGTRTAQGSPWNDNYLTDNVMRQAADRLAQPILIRGNGRIEEEDEDEEVPVDMNSLYVKGEQVIPLTAPIKRVFYVNNYAAEIFPEPNPTFLEQLAHRDILIYSAGSLWTSIIPCLALRGIGSAIARSGSLRAKVLLLNTCNDRETTGYSAHDYIDAIVRTLNRSDRPRRPGSNKRRAAIPADALITHVVYTEAGEVPIDTRHMRQLGIQCIKVPSTYGKWFSNENVRWALDEIEREQKSAP